MLSDIVNSINCRYDITLVFVSVIHWRDYKYGVLAPPCGDRDYYSLSVISTGNANDTSWYRSSKLENGLTSKILLKLYFMLILFQNAVNVFVSCDNNLNLFCRGKDATCFYLLLHSSVKNKHVHVCQITRTTQRHKFHTKHNVKNVQRNPQYNIMLSEECAFVW